jgi:hypothetical protein
MSITIRCRCGAQLRARDERAGEVTNCPKCGSELRIKADAALPPTASESESFRLRVSADQLRPKEHSMPLLGAASGTSRGRRSRSAAADNQCASCLVRVEPGLGLCDACADNAARNSGNDAAERWSAAGKWNIRRMRLPAWLPMPIAAGTAFLIVAASCTFFGRDPTPEMACGFVVSIGTPIWLFLKRWT